MRHALFRPTADDDVATAVARTGLAAHGDQRRIVADAQAPYFGAVIDDHTLAPDENATTFTTTRYSDWIDAHASRRI